MRIGLVTPIVIRNPAGHNPWEATATVEDLRRIAMAADELGFHHLAASEHIGIPASEQGRRGTVYWDALATLSYLAACTSRIRLLSHCVVLPYHHPLEIVKRWGTLDQLSGGRLTLGVGVGSLAEEFALLDIPMEGRGERADEAIAAIRSAWGVREPSFNGAHFAWDGLVVEPNGVQEHLPIWVGGRTRRSLRRAVELGSGWVPFGLAPDEVAAMLAEVEVPDDFEVVLRPGHDLIDPQADPDGVMATLEALSAAGGTMHNVRLRADSPAHFIEQLGHLAGLVDLEAP
ncbi:MAG: LLM class F420-dependent oxidoreductase [Nitriliruptorales bacterium]|nr:LLM class F420-dependent oxidoreductase [Nitriliruptorales bacterium]